MPYIELHRIIIKDIAFLAFNYETSIHIENFRSFASAIIEEELFNYFEIDAISPYMLKVPRCKICIENKIPATLNVDNTWRVQSVNEKQNKTFYDLLKEAGKRNEKSLKDSLIIGSSSSNEVIKNWSDIDAIVVLDEYNFKTIEIIKKISNSYPVKIGTTVYDKRKFEEKNIDPKTIYHLYLYENDIIDLQYKTKSISIPKVEFKDVYNNHIPYLYWRLHIYKRNFLYETLTKEQIKGIFKMTYLIMKAILIIDGATPKNYREVFKTFSKKYDFQYYDFEKFIYDYMNENEQYKNIIDYDKIFLIHVIERF